MRLVVELLGELADDLSAEALPADPREEVVEVLRGVLLVLGEHFDNVLERLLLELVELLALGQVRVFCAALNVGRLEHADEALRSLVVIPEAPVAPGALEERQTIEGRIDRRLEGEDLLVFGERARVVEPAVEDGLGLGHVRVGYEARLREVAQDLLEALAGLVFLALLVGEESVHVEREVQLLEPRIVAKHPAEQIARHAVVELRSRAALIDGLLLPCLKARNEILALVLPLKLRQADEGLGHLASFARRLGHELGEQVDRLCAQLLHLRDVGVDAGIEPGLKLLAKSLGYLRPPDAGLAARSTCTRRVRARRPRRNGAAYAALRGRLDVARGGRRRRGRRGCDGERRRGPEGNEGDRSCQRVASARGPQSPGHCTRGGPRAT